MQEPCLPHTQIYQANKSVCSHPVFTTYHPLAVVCMLSSWVMVKYLHHLLPSFIPGIYLPSPSTAPKENPSPSYSKIRLLQLSLTQSGVLPARPLNTGAFKTKENQGPFPLLFCPNVSNQSILWRPLASEVYPPMEERVIITATFSSTYSKALWPVFLL